MLRSILLLVSLAIALPATMPAATQTVLGTSVSSGASGLRWETELRFVNRGSADATVSLTFIPDSDGVSIPTSLTSSQTVPAGKSLVLSNALSTLWGLGDASGSLRIDYDQPLAIAARKQANSPLGRIGSALPIVSDSDLLEPGNIADALWLSHSPDPASGFSSNLWISFATPNASANLTLYDANGKTVAALTVSGGPDSRSIPVASLLPTDLPLGRVSLRVTSGLVAAALELTDNQTGDRMAAILGKNRALDKDVPFVAQHGPAANGRLLQTDARIVNLSGATATLTVSSPSGKNTFSVAPQGMVEIIDVLGALQSAATFDLIHVSSDRQMLVDLRTASVTQFGASGILGEIHAAAQASALLPPGATAVINQLPPGAQLFLNSWGYTTDTVGQMVLKDSAGNAIGTAPLPFDAGVVRRDALADLFPGIAIPDGAFLEVSSVAVYVDSSAIAIDPASGDVAYLPLDFPLPASVDPVAACSAPTFDLASASQATIAAPGGPVTIAWSASGADSVDIAPGASGQPASGSYQVNLTAGTVFTLTANNGCGSTTRAVTVAVGPPILKSNTVLTAPGASSASPGQLLSLQFGNLAEPEKITGIVFRSTDGLVEPATILGVGPGGDIQALVPLWLDDTTPQGYRTGRFQVSAVFQSTPSAAPVVFGSLPFTIDPLVLSGDPVAGFQALLDQIGNGLQTALSMESEAGLLDAATAQKALMSGIEAELRKMLSEISTQGNGKLPYGWSPTDPSTISASVTRNDLALLLAYNTNLTAIFSTPAAVSALALKGQGRSAGGSCLWQKVPLIPTCKYMAELDRLAFPLEDALDRLNSDPLLKLGRDQVADYVKKALQKGTLGAVKSKLKQWITPLDVLCLISPIRLSNFTIRPTRIPYSSPKNPSSRIGIFANLTPATNKNDITSYLDAKVVAQTVKSLGLKGVSKDVATAFASELLKDTDFNVDRVLADILSKIPGFQPTNQQQVGDCDLANFYPLKNGPQQKYTPRQSILELDAGQPFGQDDYFYFGRQPKKETLCINPRWDNFLFSEAIEKSRGRYFNSTCQFQPSAASKGAGAAGAVRAAGDLGSPELTLSGTVEVGPPTGGVELAQATVNCRDLRAYRVIYYAGGPLTGQQSLSDSYGMATCSVTAQQAGNGAWAADLSASSTFLEGLGNDGTWQAEATITLNVTNPPNRDSSEQISVQITPQGNCDSWTWKLVWTDENFTGYTLGPSPQLASGGVSLTFPQGNSAMVYVDNMRINGTATCNIHVGIQVSDKATPAP